MPIINFNPRNTQGLPEPRFNKLGVTLCPNDSSLPMTYYVICREKECVYNYLCKCYTYIH